MATKEKYWRNIEYYKNYERTLKRKETKKEWVKNNKESVNTSNRKWYKNRTDKQKRIKELKDNRRMAKEKNAEGSFTLEEWETKKKKFNYCCAICAISEEKLLADTGLRLTIDHIKPLSKNGTNYIENIQPLCKSCNSSKGDK